MPVKRNKIILGSLSVLLLVCGSFFAAFSSDSRNLLEMISLVLILFGLCLCGGAMYSPICTENTKKRSMPFASNDNNDADLHLRPPSQTRQNHNVSNRDGNRSIPTLDGGRLSSSANGHTSTPASTADSELPGISNEPESNEEMDSLEGYLHSIVSALGVHYPGSGSSAPNYVTSSANRSTSRTQVPSTGVHQSSVPLIRSTHLPLYGSSRTASASRSPPSYRSDNLLRPSTPPPSYQEVMEGGYPQLFPTYKQTVIHRESFV